MTRKKAIGLVVEASNGYSKRWAGCAVYSGRCEYWGQVCYFTFVTKIANQTLKAVGVQRYENGYNFTRKWLTDEGYLCSDCGDPVEK